MATDKQHRKQLANQLANQGTLPSAPAVFQRTFVIKHTTKYVSSEEGSIYTLAFSNSRKKNRKP